MYKPTKVEFEKWRRDRDSAISMLDLDSFKKFYDKYKDTIYDGEELPDDNVLLIAIYKMAVNITSISPSVKDKAAGWLIKNGFSLEI